MKYSITVEPGFFSQYDDLPKAIKKKFRRQIAVLTDNPRHPSLKIHRLEGTDFWEFYVDKGYRCVFKQESDTFALYFVGGHELIDRF